MNAPPSIQEIASHLNYCLDAEQDNYWYSRHRNTSMTKLISLADWINYTNDEIYDSECYYDTEECSEDEADSQCAQCQHHTNQSETTKDNDMYTTDDEDEKSDDEDMGDGTTFYEQTGCCRCENNPHPGACYENDRSGTMEDYWPENYCGCPYSVWYSQNIDKCNEYENYFKRAKYFNDIIAKLCCCRSRHNVIKYFPR